MPKLGYTWYPKDWGNSDSVFELNLAERGLYRELIDLAMMSDNIIEIKLDVWCRKYAIDIDSLNLIINKLIAVNLIKIDKNIISVPSCENRLNLIRGGSKGGSKSKPTPKPMPKPMPKPTIKPTPKQRERENKIKKENSNIPTFNDFFLYAKTLDGYLPYLDSAIKFKYDSWVANDWHDGNNNKIIRWKGKLFSAWKYIIQNTPKPEVYKKDIL